MSRKFVLVPLQTFMDLCSQTKKTGDTITGTVKTIKDESPKRQKKTADKRYEFLRFHTYNAKYIL